MHLSASKNSKNYNNNRKETELIQSDYDKSQNNLFATKADLSSVYPSNSSDNLNFPSHKFNKSPVKRPNAKSPIKPKDLKIQSGHYSDLRNNQTLERTTIVRASYKK